MQIFISILVILIASCAGPNKSSQVVDFPEELKSEYNPTLGLNKIWTIYQDQEDKYWFGSNGYGVYTYDGQEVTRYTADDGLIDNSIRGIQGDHLGNVYIETPAGVSKYDGTKFQTIAVSLSDDNEWKLEPNDLWFKCNGNPNDIYRYDGSLLHELTLPRMNLDSAFATSVVGLSFEGMNHSPYSVYGIDKDKKGNLLIGTIVAGAYRYDGNSFLWIGEKELTTLPDGRVPGVRSLLEDKDGNLWLSNFISKYEISSTDSPYDYKKTNGIKDVYDYFPNRIPYFNSGLSDQNGDLWMTTYTGGVWKLVGDKLQNSKVRKDQTEALLVCIYEDNDGVLWLGSDNLGVFRYNGKEFESFELMIN